MKIVAIDFETANEDPRSACSLGVSVYEDGEITKSYAFLIKPLKKYQKFIFTYIHHITLDDVIDEYEFDHYYKLIKEEFKGAYLVAHNARFDINVLNAMCDLYGLDRFKNPYLDTVLLSRRVYPVLNNHRLNTICDYLNIELDHHEAKSDSLACLMILIEIMIKLECFDPEEILSKLHLKKYYNF